MKKTCWTKPKKFWTKIEKIGQNVDKIKNFWTKRENVKILFILLQLYDRIATLRKRWFKQRINKEWFL